MKAKLVLEGANSLTHAFCLATASGGGGPSLGTHAALAQSLHISAGAALQLE